ncbi:hypothetical protein ACFLXG_03035 [Chloroflexota bacterium]
MTISSKYHQGSPKTKWKVQQCQGEKEHFKFTDKDCIHCKGKYYCESNRFTPYLIEATSKTIVFANTKEDAEECASKGYGWRTSWKCDGHIPIKIKIEGNKLSWEIDYDSLE